MRFAQRYVRPLVFLALLLSTLVVAVAPTQAAITQEQRRQIAAIEGEISAGGRMYAAGNFTESAEKVSAAQQSLIELMASKDPALQKLLKPIYSRLEKAHALLELEGAELKELPRWEELMGEGDKPAGEGVSFKTDVAPWLVAQCGNCHINNQRGKFSMVSYNELMQGINGRKVVSPGGGKGSRIVEVIESGDMPRGGGKVSDEDLAKLQKWIDEGAKFDGPDPAAPLRSYVKGAAGASASEPAEMVKAPTGKETVKFATDIAPLLVANCNGCHINGRRASGGLSMDNFAALMRGGDSGKVITAGKADDSLLIKKLKGLSGQRMPAGRPALSDEKISLISTWINEGATFDGASPTLDIESVIDQSWAAAASHAELMKRRTERAQALWKKVLPNAEPSVAANDELVVLGNVTQDRAEEWLAAAQTATADVRKQLHIPSGPIVKGGIAIFVYKGRYDYGEFGRMNENRQLPASWQAHWRASPLDVYVALVDDTALDAKSQVKILAQQIAGAYVGSLPQVPEWFAEGVARNIALATASRNDPRVELWKKELPAAAAMVDKSETLLQGKLDDEASGLVGMKLTGVMMDRRNRKRFDALLSSMREGEPFPAALTKTFAPPDKFVKSWIGK
ncbi:MAG: c-type cytochrome domain-containing protein [Aureliella sp.]